MCLDQVRGCFWQIPGRRREAVANILGGEDPATTSATAERVFHPECISMNERQMYVGSFQTAPYACLHHGVRDRMCTQIASTLLQKCARSSRD